MLSFTVERTIAAPIKVVWALLEDFGNLDWYPGPSKVEVIGSGPGMTRRLHIEGAGAIDEVLESMDSAKYTFSYLIPNIPMPVTDYRGDVRLEAADNGATTKIYWTCQLTPQGISEADTQAMMEGVYADMISNLEAAAQRHAA
ncbi:MAG: SRPBCC family protein [Halioglobus sp.]